MEGQTTDQAEFYELVGVAITTWGGIESKIFRAFRTILHTDRQLAAILFYRVPSLSARFETLDEIVGAAFPKGSDVVGEWKDIKSKCTPLIEFRNMLAHHQVSSMSDQYGSGVRIHYNENERYRGKKPKIERILIGDLRSHVAELSSLFNLATAFMRHIVQILPAEPTRKEFRHTMGLEI